MIREQALTFPCADDTLLGIVSHPAENSGGLGVIIVVGGPQYRVGSHRQFALLARHLAAAGIPALRFDVRGMGDSSGTPREFTTLDDDIASAIDALQAACPAVRQVVLWGLCDAASAALLYWQRRADPRLAGLALINPWVRSEAGLAQARIRHYYRQRLLQPAFWRKLASGRLAPLRALRDGWRNLRLARRAKRSADLGFQPLMAQALHHFPGELLFVLSGQDITAQEFADWADRELADLDWRTRQGWQVHVLAEADHTFSDPASQATLEAHTVAWLRRPPALAAAITEASS